MAYAYLRGGGRVDHISESSSEDLAGLESVVEIPSRVTVEIGYSYDGSSFNPPVAAIIVKAVSVPEFLLCFTSAERIKARELRATDPIIDDFWIILDDARTYGVNMSLPSVQMAIEHTLTQINANGVVIDVQARKAEILSGAVQ